MTKSNTPDGLPGRNSYGTLGRPVVLRTNYFEVQLAYDVGGAIVEKPLHRYAVQFVDEGLSKVKKRRAMEQILAMPDFQNVMHASDYGANIVATQKINEEFLRTKQSVLLPAKGSTTAPSALDENASEQARAARARNTITFSIDLTGSLSVRDLIDFINSTSPNAHYAGHQQLVQMLNIVMCKAPNEAAQVARLPGNKFYPHQGLPGANSHPGIDFEELAGGLVALRGYYSSVRCATGRLLLNLNVTSGAFYQAMPLLELFSKFGNSDFKQREDFVRKLKVLYERPGKTPFKSERTIIGFANTPNGKNPPFTVERFGNAHAVKFKYEDRNGPRVQERVTSVFKFFQEVLGATLKSPEIPVLNVGTISDPIYIPMEMCTVLPGQPYRKFLSGDQTTQMLKFAARVPNQNAMSIAGDGKVGGTGLKLLQLRGAQQQSIEPFGLSVNTDMLTVPGRILNAPAVTYGKKKSVRPNNGSWNCADQAFIRGGRFAKWASCALDLPGRSAVPYDDPAGQASKALTSLLEQELKKYGLQMGTHMPTQKFPLNHLSMENRDANNKILDNIFSRLEAKQIPLLFIILPNDDKWLYARIKYYGDTRYGIHTICSVGSKLAKENGQGMYIGNLALKFNLKGGGVNHEIANTLANPLDANTMLMGIDVTHPSPGSAKGAPSIASAVATRDKDLSQWPGSLRKQKGKQEMIDEKKGQFSDCVDSSILEAMVTERLECWRKYNKQLPKKILLYRDGVSEGQYALVLAQELPHFEAAFLKLYGSKDKWPKMAVIVVGKRHHTRFYATKEEEADYNPQRQKGSLNTKPGTVVDRGITGTTYHEFYMQAHQGLQGTARPAHYVVIKDDIGFNANSLEQITHSLCYLFGRAPKAVSYVPPAYYADILATRGRAYLFNTLQENHGPDSNTASGSLGDGEWNGEIHPRLKDSMFYI